MKNFDLTSMGVQELDAREMQETDGGIIWLIVAGAALLLSSCVNNVNIQVGTNNKSSQGGTASADSTLNGNDTEIGTSFGKEIDK